jgi:Fur family ferric uptake transcriptional regulator
MKQKELLKQVTEFFTAYLEQNLQRKTPERYSILEEIYNRHDHFDADKLFSDLKMKKLRVSRATVYNTLELLVRCQLVKKHQFDNNQALYEKSFGYKQHDHIICKNCHKVVEFCDPRIQQITSKMGELLKFNIDNHTLILYGLCESCEKKLSK